MTDISPPPGTTPDSAEGERPFSQRPRLKVALLAAMLALVLVALSLVGARMLGWWPQDEEPVAEPTSSPTPTGPPSPFAGTPAEDFAEAEAGIVLPEAEPVGDFTAEEVAKALEQVRRALIAARLDPTMLTDHNPDEFLTLLAAEQQAGMGAAFDAGEAGGYATQVAEDTTLAQVAPRVDGEITYDAATVELDLTVIEVTTRFVWAYAFETAPSSSSEGVVVVRDDLVWQMAMGERWGETSRGLWLADWSSQAWGVDCEAFEDGRLRRGTDPLTDLGSKMDEVFDWRAPMDAAEGC